MPELAANSGVLFFSGESLTSLRVLEMHACLTIEKMAHQGSWFFKAPRRVRMKFDTLLKFELSIERVRLTAHPPGSQALRFV
jgi:hypothetical protein